MKLLWLISPVLFFVHEGKAQQLQQASDILTYTVREPKVEIDHPPLLLLLHGLGSNERDLIPLGEQLDDRFLIVYLRAPYTQRQGRYEWYDVTFTQDGPVGNDEQVKQSAELIKQFISALSRDYDFDSEKVYIGGFSQGGIMSYEVGLAPDTPVKGLVVLSGRMMDITKETIREHGIPPVEVFISHGAEDQVIDINYARVAWKLLEEDVRVSYLEYGGAHSVGQPALEALNKWLGHQ
ncbi:MAG: hypothetical protein MK081_14290 [Flavobacteriales bacterium]|nr:hypothetical protein [Flavobacteriales bacterium]